MSWSVLYGYGGFLVCFMIVIILANDMNDVIVVNRNSLFNVGILFTSKRDIQEFPCYFYFRSLS